MSASDSDTRNVLSRERIVTEALALVDEQGIAAASMRAVADRLGVRAMSLYRHVGSREDLFDAVVERIVDELSADAAVPVSQEDIGWRAYLHGLAHGVRRYGLAHPHAFPLVSTRPSTAPWINPPLRSLRWVESMLKNLVAAGFSDDDVLFTYRTFNGFLLGFLLLETSAMVIDDPKPGDGSFREGSTSPGHDDLDTSAPVPGAITPTRTTRERQTIAAAEGPDELVAPQDDRGATDFPLIYRLRDGLTEARFEEEFAVNLEMMLSRIAEHVGR